jgi:hypothetical protein
MLASGATIAEPDAKTSGRQARANAHDHRDQLVGGQRLQLDARIAREVVRADDGPQVPGASWR